MSLPKGWELKELSELAEFKSGGTPSKSRTDYWGGETPWITVKDLKMLHPNEFHQSLSEDGAAVARIMPAGTVYVVVRGMALFKDLPVSIVDRPAAFNQDIKALTAADGIDAEFLAYALVAHKSGILQLVDQAGHGTGRLDTTLLQAFPLPVPPLPEQRKIAEILRTWDEAIDLAERLVVEAELSHVARVSQLITKSGGDKHVVLDSLVRVVTTKNTVGNTNVLTSSARLGLVSQNEYFNKSVAGANLAGYLLLEHGDFAYNRSASKGNPFGVIRRLEKYPRGILSTLYLCFRIVDETRVSGDYLSHLLQSGVLDRQLSLICQAGARSHGLLNVSKSDFLQMVIPVPPIEAQDKIARLLDAGRREIMLLDKKVDALKEQKLGLMQQLLTGKIRVTVDEGEGASA